MIQAKCPRLQQLHNLGFESTATELQAHYSTLAHILNAPQSIMGSEVRLLLKHIAIHIAPINL